MFKDIRAKDRGYLAIGILVLALVVVAGLWGSRNMAGLRA